MHLYFSYKETNQFLIKLYYYLPNSVYLAMDVALYLNFCQNSKSRSNNLIFINHEILITTLQESQIVTNHTHV